MTEEWIPVPKPQIGELRNLYKEWLATLKVGDKVALESWYNGVIFNREFGIIKRIDGNKIIIKGWLPFIDGISIVGEYITQIVSITSEIEFEIEREDIVNILKSLTFNVSNLDKIRKIIDIIGE